MEIKELEIGEVKPSPTNPRKTFDPKYISELADSVRQKGVLQPILARRVNGHFEIIAGECRFRASKEAGKETIPALIRDISDEEVLEIQVVENLQRMDLHPLEEAEGYRGLMKIPGYTVERIAEKVGRSVKYVYDRMKLLQLIAPLKKYFREDKITAGHAIILSRLSKEQQELVMGQDEDDCGGLWEHENTRGLFDDNQEDAEGESRKPVSVRELQAWVNEHCKFDPEKADPMLFPETVESLKQAKEEAEKVVSITHDHYVQETARDGQKIIGPRSWTRADGKADSETCEFSVTGVFVVGPGRGEALKVCINKEKCKTHWADFQKERAKRQKMAAKGDTAGLAAREQKEKEEREAKQREAEILKARIEKAMPAIKDAIASSIKKLSTKPTAFLGKQIIDKLEGEFWNFDKKLRDFVPVGSNADGLVRYAAFLIVIYRIECDMNDLDLGKFLKGLGLDLNRILDREAPVEDSKPASEINKKRAKKK